MKIQEENSDLGLCTLFPLILALLMLFFVLFEIGLSILNRIILQIV